MTLFFSGSIRRVITILVSLAILPALIIITYSGLEQRQKAIEDAKREVFLLSHAMAEMQKGITLYTHLILSTLGKTRAVYSMDAEACNKMFHAVVKDNHAIVNISAMDINGEVFSSSSPFEQTNLADRLHVEQAIAHRHFATGEYIQTRIGPKSQALPYAYPVLDDKGEVRVILAAALNLANLADFFDLANLPSESFVAVSDHKGIRLFFHPAREDTNPVGGAIAAYAWNHSKDASEPGISLHAGSDGVRRIFGYQPIRLYDDHSPYIYIWAGLPEKAALMAANTILIRNLVFMALAAALALLIANLAGGRTLLVPIRRLVEATRSFAEGNMSSRVGQEPAPDELRNLGTTFDAMAESLVENQNKLRTIADYTFDWEYWIGPDGSYQWVSPSCERVTGYSAAEFMADPSLMQNIVYSSDRTIFNDHLSTKNQTNKPYSVDFRIVHRSGRIVWIDHHCLRLKSSTGETLGLRVSNRDITYRKLVSQALKESEARFRSLVEGAPDAIIVQTNLQLAYVNDAGLKLFGANSTEQLAGLPIMDMVSPDYRAKMLEHFKKSNERKVSFNRLEQVFLRLDGTTVPVEISLVPITYEGRDGTLLYVHDISERQRIEARLQQAQKLESIGSLAGGIAHDFNNILFPIIGLSEMLLDDLPQKSLEHENVQEIHIAALRARDLVKQILSFSRQDGHKRIPLRIQQVLREVIKLTRATIPSNIEIRQSIQSDCGPVLADPTKIHQIAMNLITNAYHAVEETGGTITVDFKKVELGMDDVTGTLLTPGPHALFSVSDNGCGIPLELMHRIFDPYFTTKEQGKGTGLGLAVVYGITREYEGDIKVYSEVNRGTVFNVYLPLLERNDPEILRHESAAMPEGTERILIVDDEESIVRMETRMLERLGYQITARTSSLDALGIFQADPEAFDLIITDMAMPNLTGSQLTQKILEIRPGIPVIICTGFSEEINKRTGEPNDLQSFLMKPILAGDLAREVRRLLDSAEKQGN